MDFLKMMLVPAAALVLYAADVLRHVLRRRRFLSRGGNRLLSLAEPVGAKNVLALVLAALVIALSGAVGFALYAKAVLCGCGVLAAEILLKEAVLRPCYGLYEHGIIFSARYVPYDMVEKVTDEPEAVFAVSVRGAEGLVLSFGSEDKKKAASDLLKRLVAGAAESVQNTERVD